MRDLRFPIVCIVGPTASGKSALAQQVALRLAGEVVGADSMQVYRGMDIGTGKVPASERAVPHHGIDIAEPGAPFSAAVYQRYARRCFAEIDARDKRIVLCGGTGFYVRAAVDDYRFPAGDQVGNEVRDRALAFERAHGPQALWEKLRDRDAESAALIAPADVKRVARAFELLADGTSYARQKERLAHIPQLYPATFIGLSVSPDILRARIDARIAGMFEAGLKDEVERLLEQGFRDALTAAQAIGYKEVVAAIDGDIDMDEARRRIEVATHRYAKRQRTWFRKDKRITWLDADDPGRAGALADEAVELIEAAEHTNEGKADA